MNVVIIPARYASTRFPGKPLALIGRHSMIWHVYHRSLKAKRIDDVWVATDDERIFREVRGWGGKVMMTNPSHPSGTDRVAEVASRIEAEIIVNVQGDEPMIDPDVIDAVVEPLLKHSGIRIATPVTAIKKIQELFDPSVAKVVRDREGFALYFSRSPIPFARDHELFSKFPGRAVTKKAGKIDIQIFRHIGVYGYRRDTLIEFCELSPSWLEQIEKLEQLRALENKIPIFTVKVDYNGVGVDTEDDLRLVEILMDS